MKITAFNGSPRGKRGNTAIMVEAILEGAKKAGAETENVYLVQKDIGHCLGCFACWTTSPGRCVIEDDMRELNELFMESDIVLMASPLYVDHVTSIMKAFMDRQLPLVCPEFEKSPTGESKHVSRYKIYPSLVFVSNCGFPEKNQFEVLDLCCDRINRKQEDSPVIARIFRSQGELLRSEHPDLKPIQEAYKKLLIRAGEELAKNRKIPTDLQEILDEPLIPMETYFEGANESWKEKKTKE